MSPPHSDPAPAPRRRWLGALYLLLLIAGTFAAWQAHDLWLSTKEGPAPYEPRPPRPPAVRAMPPRRSAPLIPPLPAATSQSQPASALGEDLFPDSIMGPLDEDPVGVAPPAGATGLKAYSLPGSAVAAKYVWEGAIAEAASHYEEVLHAQGCTLVNHTADENGRRTLTFRDQGRRVIVVLQVNAKDAKIVDIEVTVIRLSK